MCRSSEGAPAGACGGSAASASQVLQAHDGTRRRGGSCRGDASLRVLLTTSLAGRARGSGGGGGGQDLWVGQPPVQLATRLRGGFPVRGAGHSDDGVAARRLDLALLRLLLLLLRVLRLRLAAVGHERVKVAAACACSR